MVTVWRPSPAVTTMPPRLTAWMVSSVGMPLSLSWDVGAPAQPGRRRVAAPVALLGESYRLLESTAPIGCRHGEGEWLRGVHRLRTVWQARHVRGAAVPGVRRRPAQRHRDVQARRDGPGAHLPRRLDPLPGDLHRLRGRRRRDPPRLALRLPGAPRSRRLRGGGQRAVLLASVGGGLHRRLHLLLVVRGGLGPDAGQTPLRPAGGAPRRRQAGNRRRLRAQPAAHRRLAALLLRARRGRDLGHAQQPAHRRRRRAFGGGAHEARVGEQAGRRRATRRPVVGAHFFPARTVATSALITTSVSTACAPGAASPTGRPAGAAPEAPAGTGAVSLRRDTASAPTASSAADNSSDTVNEPSAVRR